LCAICKNNNIRRRAFNSAGRLLSIVRWFLQEFPSWKWTWLLGFFTFLLFYFRWRIVYKLTIQRVLSYMYVKLLHRGSFLYTGFMFGGWLATVSVRKSLGLFSLDDTGCLLLSAAWRPTISHVTQTYTSHRAGFLAIHSLRFRPRQLFPTISSISFSENKSCWFTRTKPSFFRVRKVKWNCCYR